MTTTWNPEEYTDSYRERVEDLIARKRRGEEIVKEGEPAGEGDVTDLMEALRRSAEQMKGRLAGQTASAALARQNPVSERVRPASACASG